MIEGMTEVCVYISAEIARPLTFTVSTVDGTATSVKYLLLMHNYDLYAASLALLCYMHNYPMLGRIILKLQICAEVS